MERKAGSYPSVVNNFVFIQGFRSQDVRWCIFLVGLVSLVFGGRKRERVRRHHGSFTLRFVAREPVGCLWNRKSTVQKNPDHSFHCVCIPSNYPNHNWTGK